MSDSNNKLKVLLVEDETIIAMSVCNSLQQFGYFGEHVNSGEKALDHINRFDVDLVLMDIHLGEGIDGIETSKKILAIKEIPIIFLSAFSDKATLDRAQITEPSGFIVKPFHSRELYITIELAMFKFQSNLSFRKMQSMLFESQKMESIGLLASGIAHEINNPLMAIVNFSILGQELAKTIENTTINHYFSTIQNESERISIIIKNLVSYSMDDREHWVWSDLIVLIEEILSFFRQLFIYEKIQLNWIRPTNFPTIFCKPQKLKQAVLNLISFCKESCLEDKSNQARWIRIHLETCKDADGNDTVVLDISDSGRGIHKFFEDSKFRERDQYGNNFSLPSFGFYFSQSIALEHKGNIFVIDISNGKVLRMVFPILAESSNRN